MIGQWSPQCSPLIGPQRARPGVHHLPRGGAQDDGGQRLGGHLLLHACGRLFEVVNVWFVVRNQTLFKVIGIDSEFCIVESLVTGIVDMYPDTLR